MESIMYIIFMVLLEMILIVAVINMVLGVNDYDNKDFIYFVKYFQRIQKHCGVDYNVIL